MKRARLGQARLISLRSYDWDENGLNGEISGGKENTGEFKGCRPSVAHQFKSKNWMGNFAIAFLYVLSTNTIIGLP